MQDAMDDLQPRPGKKRRLDGGQSSNNPGSNDDVVLSAGTALASGRTNMYNRFLQNVEAGGLNLEGALEILRGGDGKNPANAVRDMQRLAGGKDGALTTYITVGKGAVALGRPLDSTPHSADVEELIADYGLGAVKTEDDLADWMHRFIYMDPSNGKQATWRTIYYNPASAGGLNGIFDYTGWIQQVRSLCNKPVVHMPSGATSFKQRANCILFIMNVYRRVFGDAVPGKDAWMTYLAAYYKWYTGAFAPYAGKYIVNPFVLAGILKKVNKSSKAANKQLADQLGASPAFILGEVEKFDDSHYALQKLYLNTFANHYYTILDQGLLGVSGSVDGQAKYKDILETLAKSYLTADKKDQLARYLAKNQERPNYKPRKAHDKDSRKNRANTENARLGRDSAKNKITRRRNDNLAVHARVTKFGKGGKKGGKRPEYDRYGKPLRNDKEAKAAHLVNRSAAIAQARVAELNNPLYKFFQATVAFVAAHAEDNGPASANALDKMEKIAASAGVRGVLEFLDDEAFQKYYLLNVPKVANLYDVGSSARDALIESGESRIDSTARGGYNTIADRVEGGMV